MLATRPVTKTLQQVHKCKCLSVSTVTVDIEALLVYPHTLASASSYCFPTVLQKLKVTYTEVTTQAHVHNLG